MSIRFELDAVIEARLFSGGFHTPLEVSCALEASFRSLEDAAVRKPGQVKTAVFGDVCFLFRPLSLFCP